MINKNNFINSNEKYDAIVVGLGHAGCEAALALARIGYKTLAFGISIDNVAMMACNPNIGGTSKGHIVKEIDALGGEMGKNIDATFIQSKMLNKSKGPAVHSLRAQADKKDYSSRMRKVLENTKNLTLKQSEIKHIIIEETGNKKIVTGVITVSNIIYSSNIVILATGVYLNARCLYGEVIENTGPNGLMAATYLTQSLLDNGIEILRFKTGTPARVDKNTVDLNKLEIQKGDETITPFSFWTNKKQIQKEQIDCYLVYTNEKTHNIIKQNIKRSPLFNGTIKGVGPRYCPSIEDKIMRFADKEKHQIFVEPEGLYTNELYLSGMSSSLPYDVQIQMIRSMTGFEKANIVRNAYAIEYDLINPIQLKLSLEFKEIDGLFAAGQINGSSGYEEAAGQGLIAGINAALKLQNKEPLILKRSESYIGVLIDDLITKELTEPYRMMTSRAEYRLLLRQDNADLRLTEYGYKIGLINEYQYLKTKIKQQIINEEIEKTKKIFISSNDKINKYLQTINSSSVENGISVFDLIKRPEIIWDEQVDIFLTITNNIKNKINEYNQNQQLKTEDIEDLVEDIKNQIFIEIKYDGYIKREQQQVERFKNLENKTIPDWIDYNNLKNLRLEARQKLSKFKPKNIGMASRISGVSPSDIAVLIVEIKNK